MLTPQIAQQSPFEVPVKRDRKYFWCACGRSRKQPFCDGSHKGTGFEPVEFVAAADEKVWLCGCKRTGTRPFCDGTHNTL
ncbi:MAG: CDGSH iron-sulfur domain-containing protein [Alphaproteobacteria bacterium]|nr:CDGSH iron-sulfur domain-containing protein [Alphaproteobacteria bacterium]